MSAHTFPPWQKNHSMLILLLAGLAAEFGSWQVSYLIWVMLQALLALITFLFIHKQDQPKDMHDVQSLTTANKPSIILYYVMAITLGFSFGGFTTYMPSLFGMQNEGIFKVFPVTLRAGFFTTLVFLSGIVGQTIGGFLGDKYNRAHLLWIIIIVNIPFMSLMGYTEGWLLFLSSIALGIVYFLNQPVSNALLADLIPSSHRGIGYGISFFLSFGIGGIAPAVSGWITERYAIEMVFPVMAASLLPGVVAGWFLIQRMKNQTA